MAWVQWEAYGHPVTGIDDGDIYQVYMRNLAAGHGFVFHPGGERVEGFTSLLWTVMGGLAYRWTAWPEAALALLSIVMVNVLLVRLVLALAVADRPVPAGWKAAFLLALLAAAPGYFDWALLTRMETALWSLLLTLLSLEAAGPNRGRAATMAPLLVLLALTRPESVLWGPVFLGLRFWRGREEGLAPVEAWRLVRAPALLFALTVVVLTVWRLYYFGYPLPNTYYAKVSADWLANLREGLFYLGKFLLVENPALLLAGSLLGVWLAMRHRHVERPAGDASLVVLAVIALVNLAVPVLSGGDHFVLGRPLQPLVPVTWAVFILLFFRLVQLDLPGLSRSARKLLPALAFLFAVALMPARFRFYDYGRQPAPLQKEFALASEGRALGEALSRFFEPLDTFPTVGVICAGGIGYTYHGRTLDLMGLNLVSMAHAQSRKPSGRRKNHASFDPAVFFRLQPDLFLTTRFVDDPAAFTFLEDRPDRQTDFFGEAVGHIYATADFGERYQAAFIRRQPDGPVLHSYFRKDFLDRLSQAGYQVLPENFSRPR